MVTEPGEAVERYKKALDQRKETLSDMSREALIEEAARAGVEYSRLNDRYMALLHDRRSEQDAMRAVALHSARSQANRIVWQALRERQSALGSSLPFLLDLLDQLPDVPTAAQVRALRPPAERLRQDLRYLPPKPVEADLAAMLRHELVTRHHDAVLKWQEMGGSIDE